MHIYCQSERRITRWLSIIHIDESHPLYSFVKSSWLWRFKLPYSNIKGLKNFRLRVYKEELVVTFINLDCFQRFFFTSHIQNIVVNMNSLYQIRSKIMRGTKGIILVEKNRKRGGPGLNLNSRPSY